MDEIAKAADRLFVFSEGGIVMSGTPREVFSRGEELRGMGLAVPKMTLIAARLRELGLDINSDIYTIEQMRAALLAIRGGESHA
jgi:energy-coupling factor transport system ATP-binding protein